MFNQTINIVKGRVFMRGFKVFIGLLVLFMVAACETSTENDIPTESDGVLSVSVLDVSEGEETLFGELPDDQMWLLVEVAIENVGLTARNINTALMFSLLYDEHTVEHDLFADTHLSLEGTLDVGARKAGVLTYAVDETQETFKLRFTPNINEPGYFEFDIELNDET